MNIHHLIVLLHVYEKDDYGQVQNELSSSEALISAPSMFLASSFFTIGGADEILDQMRSLTGGGYAHVFL